MEIVSSEHLTISYDGDSLKAGLMDVEDLAPALLATASLIRRANHVLNGETTHVDLKVDSGFERGSFNINLVVDQGLLEQAKNFLLNHPGIKDAKDILETIFFYGGLPSMVFGGLFKLIKVLNGAKPDTVKFQKDGDIVTIGIGVREIKVTKNTYNLYLDPQIRRSADQMVAPLQGEGIDALEIRKGTEIERIDKAQVPAFHVSEIEGELLLDSTSEAWVSVIALSFNPNHKWKFSTGGSTFSANITDDDFWDRVHKQIVKFSEGDQLLVRLRTTTARDDRGLLRTRYLIERVINHQNTAKQARLDLDL